MHQITKELPCESDAGATSHGKPETWEEYCIKEAELHGWVLVYSEDGSSCFLERKRAKATTDTEAFERLKAIVKASVE